MPKIKITAACSFEPFFRGDAIGDVIEVEETLAADMIAANVAIPHVEEPAEDGPKAPAKKKN